MVLQRDMRAPVWGTAEPNAEVTVEFANQRKTTKADASGKWIADLDPMPASAEPRELRITQSNPQSAIPNPQFKDVLVGDVWVC